MARLIAILSRKSNVSFTFAFSSVGPATASGRDASIGVTRSTPSALVSGRRAHPTGDRSRHSSAALPPFRAGRQLGWMTVTREFAHGAGTHARSAGVVTDS